MNNQVEIVDGFFYGLDYASELANTQSHPAVAHSPLATHLLKQMTVLKEMP